MMQAKLPLTAEDAKVSNVERNVPAIDTLLTTTGRAGAAPVDDPLFDASLESRKVPALLADQNHGPRVGVVRDLAPLTVIDARVSNVPERRDTPPPSQPPPQNPVQDRGEPAGDPLLDTSTTTLVEEEHDDTTTAGGVNLDVRGGRHKMKSQFPCTSVVGPEDVHREVGPPKA
jgi:hypothetical protein